MVINNTHKYFTMAKFLLIDKTTDLLLHVEHMPQITKLLCEGIPHAVVRRIDTGHPFYQQITRTLMASKKLVVTANLAVSDQSSKPFPPDTMISAEHINLRYPVMGRLIRMVSTWMDDQKRVLFLGLDSIIEIELRDCDRTTETFTAAIHYHAEMLGITATQAYDQLNSMVTYQQQCQLRGMSFIEKYAKMINTITTPADAEKINGFMYQEWAEFLLKFTRK